MRLWKETVFKKVFKRVRQGRLTADEGREFHKDATLAKMNIVRVGVSERCSKQKLWE